MDNAIKAIQVQQDKENGQSPAWMVGEQLKDICRREPHSAELVETDLTSGGMTLRGAEAKIKAFADELHKTSQRGNCVCVTPIQAENIIRKYFGLTEAASATAPEDSAEKKDEVINLEDFF